MEAPRTWWVGNSLEIKEHQRAQEEISKGSGRYFDFTELKNLLWPKSVLGVSIPRPIMPLSWTSHLNCTSSLGYQEISFLQNVQIIQIKDLAASSPTPGKWRFSVSLSATYIGYKKFATEDEPLPQGSLGIQDRLSGCDTTLTTPS